AETGCSKAAPAAPAGSGCRRAGEGKHHRGSHSRIEKERTEVQRRQREGPEARREAGMRQAQLLSTLCGWASLALYAQPPSQPATGARDLFVTVGKSVLVDSPATIERVSVANGDIAEAVAITPREVLVNGRAPGETSLIVWQQGGNRLFFDLFVRRND